MDTADLRSYAHIGAEIRGINDTLERLKRYAALPSDVSLRGESGGHDLMRGAVAEYEALCEYYDKKLSALLYAQVVIESVIDTLEPMTRTILRERYIHGKSWEDIAKGLGYSTRTVLIRHEEAMRWIVEL